MGSDTGWGRPTHIPYMMCRRTISPIQGGGEGEAGAEHKSRKHVRVSEIESVAYLSERYTQPSHSSYDKEWGA